MIRKELKKQLHELEKRYAAVPRKVDPLRHYARLHAIRVAATALYGEPKIDEPLMYATLRSKPVLEKEIAAKYQCSDCAEELLRLVFYPLFMFGALPGAGDNVKFERVFSETPDWLLKFTGVEWDANILGFKLRELEEAPALGRKARRERNRWPNLPYGTIDAGGPCSNPDGSWKRIVKRRCRELDSDEEPIWLAPSHLMSPDWVPPS